VSGDAVAELFEVMLLTSGAKNVRVVEWKVLVRWGVEIGTE